MCSKIICNERWDLKLPLFTFSTRFPVTGLFKFFLDFILHISVLLQSLLPEKHSGEIVSRISLVIYKSLSERSSYMCHSGAEKTRDELRQQVYDAMAEKEKAEDPHSPVTGDEKSLSQETEMDGVSSVKSVREGSLGKETEIEQKADSSEEQTGNGTGVKPVRGCDEDKEETEGSRA